MRLGTSSTTNMAAITSSRAELSKRYFFALRSALKRFRRCKNTECAVEFKIGDRWVAHANEFLDGDFSNITPLVPVKKIPLGVLISFKSIFHRTMKFSTGKMAKLANGAVVAEVKLYYICDKIWSLVSRVVCSQTNHDPMHATCTCMLFL